MACPPDNERGSHGGRLAPRARRSSVAGVKPTGVAKNQTANDPVRGQMQEFACIPLRIHALFASYSKEPTAWELLRAAIGNGVAFARQLLVRAHASKGGMRKKTFQAPLIDP